MSIYQYSMAPRQFVFLALILSSHALSQTADSSTSLLKLFSQNKSQVREAIEIESLFPMFFYGGYHLGIGYRFSEFRLRASIIKGGTYNVEPNGLNNSKELFHRLYARPGYGIFFGMNVLENWELYTYIERHTFGIEQIATFENRTMYSTDFGAGTSYQVFVGRWFYLQPGFHLYIRSSQSIVFTNGKEYSLPRMDISPVIRAGIRIWQVQE